MPMKKGDFVFVYGTLRQGQVNDLSRWGGGDEARFVGADTISGRLFDCGWYPGVKDAEDFGSSEDFVKGEVFELLDDATVPGLDGYEGYPILYDRKTVLTEGGHRAWVYTYNGPVEDSERIAGGDWLEHEAKMNVALDVGG